MTGDPDTLPLFGGWQEAGDESPAATGEWPLAAPGGSPGGGPDGARMVPPVGEALVTDQKRPRRGISATSVVAGVCGLLGLFLGPFLITDTPDRYLVFVLDVVALAMGGVGIWAAFKFRARFDWAVLGLLTGGLSLVLYVVYVIDPPPTPAGGT